MTAKEALKILKADKDEREDEAVACSDYITICVIEAESMAIKALEEQSEAEEYRTPMKVKRYKTHCNGKDFTYKITCPSCNESLCRECFDKKTTYCMNCGQALDWSEVEE